MATFPILKTGAVAQYPLTREVRFATQTVRFLDGSRQSYRLSAGGLRCWALDLDMLDEAELAAVAAFAEEVGSSTFQFTDPMTGESVARCVIADGQFEMALLGELHGRTKLEIEEVK